MLSFLIRSTHKRSDCCFLVLASIVGIAAGRVVSKFAPVTSIPFSIAAILLLYFMWRTPIRY